MEHSIGKALDGPEGDWYSFPNLPRVWVRAGENGSGGTLKCLPCFRCACGSEPLEAVLWKVLGLWHHEEVGSSAQERAESLARTGWGAGSVPWAPVLMTLPHDQHPRPHESNSLAQTGLQREAHSRMGGGAEIRPAGERRPPQPVCICGEAVY